MGPHPNQSGASILIRRTSSRFYILEHIFSLCLLMPLLFSGACAKRAPDTTKSDATAAATQERATSRQKSYPKIRRTANRLPHESSVPRRHSSTTAPRTVTNSAVPGDRSDRVAAPNVTEGRDRANRAKINREPLDLGRNPSSMPIDTADELHVPSNAAPIPDASDPIMSAQTIRRLHTDLGNQNPVVRAQAVRTLAGVDDQNVSALLIQAIKDPDDTVRQVALDVVGTVPVEAQRDVLSYSLYSSHPDVRLEALKRLEAMGGDEVVAILQERAPTNDPVLQEEIQQVLQTIKERSKTGKTGN